MPWSKIVKNYGKVDGDRILTYKDAIGEAIDQAMSKDPRVFAIGLDANDKFNVFGSMDNVTHKERVIGTPVSENAMTGVALGAALSGMRPIYIHLRVDFMLLAMDQIVNYIAKWRYMFQGQVKVPIVIRAVIGRGWGSGAQHSDTLQALFTHIPGLKVIMPSNPYDAKGLLLAAVEDDYPVIFIEHRWLYNNTCHVPQEPFTLPIGKGKIAREGNKLTIVATSIAVIDALLACGSDLDVEIIDPRTLKPLDEDLILQSLDKTGHLLVIDYDFPMCSFASEVCALAAEKGFRYLKAPVSRMTFPESHMPASAILEKKFYPDPARIAERIRKLINSAP